MAIFTDSFNGTNNVEVTTMTKTKGGALEFQYVPAENAIAPDSTAGDIRYRHDTLPGSRNCRALVRFQFHIPDVASRILRVFLRYDSADQNGYYVQVDTNFDNPEIKLFKLVAGVASQIGSTFNPGAGTIPVDTDRDIEIQVDEDTILVWWNDNTSMVSPDISAQDSSVYVHEGIGIGTQYCDATDVLIQNLEVNAPRKAAAPAGTGLLLKVDGVEYDEDALADNNLQILSLRKSVISADTLEFLQVWPFTRPLFRPEQTVELYVDITGVRTRVFHGKIRTTPQDGSGNQERISYTAYGYRANWQYIEVEHPTTLSSEIVWNALAPNEAAGEPGDNDYDSTFSNMTVGDYLKYWLDYYVQTIQFYFGCDPAAGLPYVQADLDDLTNIPTKTTISGTLDQHIQAALQMQKNRVLVMDYGVGQLRVRNLDDLTAYEIAADDKRIQSINLGLDTSRVFTAARVKGVTRELVQATATTLDDSLVPAWDATLESDWTRDRAKRKEMSFKVVSVSVGTGPGGRDEIVLNSAAEEAFANEWVGTSLYITSGAALDDHFEVYSNTGPTAGSYTFVINGNFAPAPSAGDYVKVTDDQTLATTKRHNGFAYVYTLFRIADTNKRAIASEKCAHLKVVHKKTQDLINLTDANRAYMGKVTLKDVPKNELGYVRVQNPVVLSPKDLSVPTIVWRVPGCNETSYQDFLDKEGKVELEYEYYQTTVVQARYPTEGWYGEAFSYNAAKWGVASAVPEFGDIGVMREELVQDSELRYSDQATVWASILEERVKLTSRAPWTGTISYRGLDWTNVNFTRKLNITFDPNKRGSPNWEGQDLIPIDWTWDFVSNLNIVSLGTMSSFVRDLEDVKKTDAALNRANTNMMRRLRALQDLQECMQRNEQAAGASDPGPICGTDIYTGAEDPTGGGDDRGANLDWWIAFLWWIWLFFLPFLEAIWSEQKGITNITPTYDDDGLPNGFSFDFGGSTYHVDGDGVIRDGDGNPATPFANGFNGKEGGVQDMVTANKALWEGYSFGGFVNGLPKLNDGVTDFYPKKDGSGFTTSNTGVGTTYIPVQGGIGGSLLKNLGKTIDKATGQVVTPGTTAGASGAKYYPLTGGAPSDIAAGGRIPASLSSLVLSNKKLAEGATVNADGSVTFPNGSFYPLSGGGWIPKPGSGPGGSTPTTGPSVGGALGAAIGKCGTTLHGATTPGSGPGALVPPGTAIDADLAIYYPPTQALDDADYIILPDGGEAPASSTDILFATAKLLDLAPSVLDDPGGVVFTDGSLLWRLEVSTGDFRKVSNTVGTGLNSGDYSWVTPAVYFSAPYAVPADVAAAVGAHELTVDHPTFTGDAGSGGVNGMVPAPAAGDAAAGKYLDADGTWTVPPAGGSTPTGTGFRHVTGGTEDGATKLVESADVHSNLKDPVAGTAGLRTLGTGAQAACAGNDARLSDSRAPTGSAGGILSGSYPSPDIAAGRIVPKFCLKTADETGLGSTFTDITSLSFSVANGKTYAFHFFIVADSDATTTGIDVAVNGPTTTFLYYTQKYWTGGGARPVAATLSYDNNTASTGSNGPVARIFEVHGIIKPSADGTLAARIKREAVGSGPNVRAGSHGFLWPLD